MGSPLARVLANLFIGHYEKEQLSNYDAVSPYYTRYVTIFFLVFNLNDEAERIFNYLNSRHLILNFLWKLRLTKLFPFWMSLLIIVTIF